MFEFTKTSCSAILDALAYITVAMNDPSDPVTSKLFNSKFNNLATRLISQDTSFTKTEITIICEALDLFIKESGEATMSHISILSKLSVLLKSYD